MTHNKHVLDGVNKDVRMWPGASYEEAKNHYLEMCEGWMPYNPPPVVKVHDNIRVVRDDLIVGTKTRAGDLLASHINHDTIVYSQPRTGLAGVSILDVAVHHNKKVVLFMPASKRISLHHTQICTYCSNAKS